MHVKILIFSLFAILLISGITTPSMVSGQDSDIRPGYNYAETVSECNNIPEQPITFTLDKESYAISEEIKISGQVIPKAAKYSSDITRNYVYLTIPDYKSTFIINKTNLGTQPTPEDYNPSRIDKTSSLSTLDTRSPIDECGFFETSVKLHPIVFTNGYYVLELKYADNQLQKTILVFDNSLQIGCYITLDANASNDCDNTSFSVPEVILETQKNEYLPGEHVKISGHINNIIYNDNVKLILKSHISSENSNEESQEESKSFKFVKNENPTFFWNYKLQTGAESIGNYSVSAVTHLGTVTKFFTVNDESIVTEYAVQKSSSQNKIIDKFNRIIDSEIGISLGEKTSGEKTLLPRVLQGSLFTVARGEESSVNIQLISSSGQCVIGQDDNCMVSNSTRSANSIYELVQINGENYKVRYSGPDVRLEKFTILPETSNTEIDTKNWDVTILKDDQPTRFYYKISYVAFE